MIIAKLLANRIKVVLPFIVSSNQSAFVAGRKIRDNILVIQELFRNYHKEYGPPRCALKVDLRKTYDSLSRTSSSALFQLSTSLLKLLSGFVYTHTRAHTHTYISSTKFRVPINGDLAGFFPSRRGLRQGDPMFPFLFVIAMEVLTKVIQSKAQHSPLSRFHWKCDKLQLANLCFADDLMLFSHGDLLSATVLREAMNYFQDLSGLKANASKSNIFMAEVDDDLKDILWNCFNFRIGVTPTRYLGIPIFTTMLTYHDFSLLLERTESKIKSWENKSLSFAGSVQLIQATLCSIQIY